MLAAMPACSRAREPAMPPVYEPGPGGDPLTMRHDAARTGSPEVVDTSEGPRIEDVLDRFRARLDAAVGPIEHADETIDGVVSLTKYLALPGKRKADARRLVAEVGKVVAGQGASLASLGLDADLLEAATERVTALSALAAALRTAEATQERLGAELHETIAAAHRAAARETARARSTEPERIRVIEAIVADLPEREGSFQQRIGSLDRAKEIRARLDRAFR
jgi:hypothetical protein